MTDKAGEDYLLSHPTVKECDGGSKEEENLIPSQSIQ